MFETGIRLFSSKGNVDSTAMLETNKSLIRRTHSEVWSKGDMEVVDEIYAPEFIGHWPKGFKTNGLNEFKDFVRRGRSEFPDWNETVEQIVAEGDLVVTRFISRGTFAGKSGVPPDGRQVEMQEIAIHRIVHGKIAEQWTLGDVLSMREQLGILSTKEAKSERAQVEE